MLVALCDFCLAEGKLKIAKGSGQARVQNYGADTRAGGLRQMIEPEAPPSNLYAGKVTIHFCAGCQNKAKDDMTFAEKAQLLEKAEEGLKKHIEEMEQEDKLHSNDGEEGNNLRH